MTFDWNDYLVIAKKLQKATNGKSKSNENDALRRTAVSRAYYAIYHYAVEYAEKNQGYQKPSKSYHPHLRLHYQCQPDYKHQQVRGLLFGLHKARVGCDYHNENVGDIESLLESSMIQIEKIKSNLVA